MNSVLDFTGPKTTSDGTESLAARDHRLALRANTGHALALRKLLEGWETYAHAHRTRYDGSIGQDYVLGDHWAQIGLSIKALLDGETRGLDCGSLSGNIVARIRAEGIETDGYSLTSAKE